MIRSSGTETATPGQERAAPPVFQGACPWMSEWAVPGPPAWRVDWPLLCRQFPLVNRLAGVPQPPRYHEEGDALAHTRLTCEMLAVSRKWRAHPERERIIIFIAALLHDIGKVVSPPAGAPRDHGRYGARLARRLLYEGGVPFRVREPIVNLIRYHQVPFWILERENPASLVLRMSFNVRCDWLATLAAADAKGRTTDEKDSLLAAVALYAELAESLDCLLGPAEFGSSHGRYLFFEGRWHMPDFAPPESFRCRVVIMSGLPGAGKTRWVVDHCPDLPRISLPERPDADGAAPLETAGEAEISRARDYLDRGASFVWDGANLGRAARRRIARLAAANRARIEIVYKERPFAALFDAPHAPSAALSDEARDRLIHGWEVPDPWEGDALSYVVDAG